MEVVIKKSTLDFLHQLSSNNDRVWFAAHKPRYEQAKTNVEQFVDALILLMNRHDQIETPSGKKSLYRIYNDVRFSKDKSPYNARFAGYLRRVKPWLRGGYYFWITPAGATIACGFASPNPADLQRMRQDIETNFDTWNQLLKLKKLVSNFGTMQGAQVRTSPRGYAADHPAIDLLRYKQYWFERSFIKGDVTDMNFLKEVNKSFKSIRPFFDYVSEVLTSDANGESIL